MKSIAKIILFVSIFNFAFANLFSTSTNFNEKPAPLEEKKFEFPKYEVKELKNGLRVIVVEDHEQPTLSISLMIKSGSGEDGNKYGTAELTADMLLKGASSLSAYDISKKIDGIGATLSTSASPESINIWGNCLKDHASEMLGVFSDVLLKPTFPEDELEKMIKNRIADLQLSKSEGSILSNKLSKKVVYGMNNPYATTPTEQTFQSITPDDLKEYYKKWFLPQNATIAIIGDTDPKEAMKLLEQYFGNWKPGKFPETPVKPVTSMPKGIYFIERPGSVQSSMYITALGPGFKSPDYLALSLASKVMGSSPTGRLFKTLREKYSFTYSPYAFLSSSKNYNRMVCVAEVATAKTDSSIQVVFDELNDLANNGPDSTELKTIKDYTLGSFYMSLESTDNIADLIQKYDLAGMALRQIENYPVKIKALTKLDIQYAADKYCRPENNYVVITGDPKIEESLSKYGKIFVYNTNLESTALDNLEKVSMDAKELFKKYKTALGGDKIDNISALQIDGDAELTTESQKFTGKTIEQFKDGNKFHSKLDLGPILQESWVYGDSAWSSMNNLVSPATGEELDHLKEEAIPFFDTELPEKGYKCTVLGKKASTILVKAISPDGKEYTLTFNANTYLLEKKEYFIQGQNGQNPVTEYYKDYSAQSGLMVPGSVKVETPGYIMNRTKISYTTGMDLDDNIFRPANNK